MIWINARHEKLPNFLQAAAAFQLARGLQNLPGVRGEILARRNHHPEKLAGQKVLLQRLQREGGGDMETPETRSKKHLTQPANRTTNLRRKAQPNNK